MKRLEIKDKMLYLINTCPHPGYPFYLKHIGSLVNQHPCLRPKGLTDYQILCCTSGEGYFVVNNHEYHISPGMGMILKPNTPHEYHAIKEPWSTFWILFSGSGVSCLEYFNEIETHRLFYVRSFDKLVYLFDRLYAAADQSGLLNNNDVALKLYHFLLDFPDCISSGSIYEPETDTRFSDVVRYIEENYYSDISLDELASIVKLTPQHLCRLFKKNCSLRPVEYITLYRLSKAKNLLRSSDNLTLKEIAYKVGFHDTSYFCAQFKKYEGVTPTQFRQKEGL